MKPEKTHSSVKETRVHRLLLAPAAGLILVACGSGISTTGERSPLDADTSTNSTAIAAMMLPSISASLQRFLDAHPTLRPDSGEVTRWVTDQATFLPSPDDWNPSTPPYWLVYSVDPNDGQVRYGIASYVYGGGNDLLGQGNTWGHACGGLALDAPRTAGAAVNTITEVDCPAGMPETFNSFNPPNLMGAGTLQAG